MCIRDSFYGAQRGSVQFHGHLLLNYSYIHLLSVYTISVIQYTSVRQEMQEEITINTAINNTAIKTVFSTGSLPV